MALLYATMAYAQPVDRTLADLISAAEKQLRIGNTTNAKELFTSALRKDPNSVPARIGIGKAAIQEEEWSDGCDIFDEALDRNPGNMFAHYGAAICRREYGSQISWILRNVQWGKAADHFDWILARDSTFEDVLYQRSLLHRYRSEYLPAFELAHRQLQIRPDLSEAGLGLFGLYRYYIAVEDSLNVLDSLAAGHNDHVRYFMGEVLRRKNNLAAAERVFLELLGRPREIPPAAMLLSLARISFAMGDPLSGEKYYWRAVDGISTWLGGALIFEDVKYLVSDAELGAFRAITSDKKKAAFFHRFWDLRNPAPASRTNARLAEHYRRYLLAEKNYEYFGFRSYFNNPDKLHYLEFPKSFALNREFNDKGIIYLRHGEPTSTTRTMGGTPYESWLYSATSESPKRIFHFGQSNSVGNNWRFTSIPEDPEMLGNLLTWDSRYYNLLSGQTTDRLKWSDDLRQESKAVVHEALATDEHTWTKRPKTFAMPHSIDVFRSAQGKSLVNISYALPIASLKNEAADTVTRLPIEVGVSITGLNGEPIDSRRDTLYFDLLPDPGAWFVELYRFVLPPDSLKISMHAYPIGTAAISTWNSRMRIPDYRASTPLLSDIEFLLPSTAASSVEIDGVKVIASPFDAVPRSKLLLVYWQLYNLTKDIEGKTRYVSHVLLTPGESGPNDETTVVYEKDRSGRDEMAAEFAQIDLRGFSKGVYTLTVQVEDRMMVHTLSKSRIVSLTGE
jgi:tetratricopeptide (TPR) repeat protein